MLGIDKQWRPYDEQVLENNFVSIDAHMFLLN